MNQFIHLGDTTCYAQISLQFLYKKAGKMTVKSPIFSFFQIPKHTDTPLQKNVASSCNISDEFIHPSLR